ncbi:MAG: inositol monophosphatase family protein [Bacillaceae bacterium]|nr:inositol monophosphatase family protein [Bacillaceae bacterium]
MYEQAKKWTLEAGEHLRESLKLAIDVEFKTSASDLVTEKDREIEQFFAKKINEHFPNHYILGEEGTVENQNYNVRSETVWIIDPIDGTTNFVNQKMNFAISVALYEKGLPVFGIVYDPIKDELFHALKGKGAYVNDEKLVPLKPVALKNSLLSFNAMWAIPNEKVDYKKMWPLIEKSRGVRYIGSAALEIVWIAVGRLDAYIDFRLSPWDIAAGVIILQELGGEVHTLEEQLFDLFVTSSTLFSRPTLSSEIKRVTE